MSEEIKKVTKSNLTFKEKLTIVNWLSCVQEKLKTEKPTYVEVCKWVLTELNITIKPTPLRCLCNDSGITWEAKQPSNKSSGLGAVWESIKTIQDEVIKLMQSQEQIRAQLAEIRGAIVTICKEAGVKTTPGFMAKNDAPTTTIVNNKR